MQRSGSAFIAMHCLSVAGNGSVTFYALLPPSTTHNSLSHPTTKVHGHCSPNLSQVHCTPYSYSVSNARHCLNWIFRQHRPLECKGMDDKCIASTIFTRTKTKTKTKSGTSQQRFPTTTSRLATNWCNNQIGDIRPQTQDWRRKSAKTEGLRFPAASDSEVNSPTIATCFQLYCSH